MSNNDIPLVDLLTVQEHKFVGGSVFETCKSPYIPVAVLDERLSVEECNKRRHSYKECQVSTAFLWGVSKVNGNMSLEELNLDEKSPEYGCTVKDPVLVSVNGHGYLELLGKANRFPFKRDGPVLRLKNGR
ncbi:hypothetical protein GOV12_00410 [Candidatus Pacearchaeota archaeon]|nr:hypothetical protein [Candidatus Pacearchaeota archaeon]